MCGIAGIAGIPPQQAVLSKMANAMIHRGPDDEGYFLGSQIGLAFRRLSILDLHSGHQPMGNEDGRVQVVFNGQIYNHLELRQQLIAKGHRFATDHSDTEVLVHGWEEWGNELFNKLNGMFGVAIWDERQQTLILARDRYGIKPLYFSSLTDGSLVFSSEIKPILASGLVEQKPSFTGILEYFSFQNLWQQQTMFAGINQLEPGCILVWHNQKYTQQQYWDITFPRSRKESFASLTEEYRSLLQKAVQNQLIADVPVTTYLSGGVDSTAISLCAHQVNSNLKAYSCIFDLTGVTEGYNFDEREYSRLVAQSVGMNRIEHTITPTALAECLDRYVYALEDLRMGMGYVNYLIAGRVAQDAKVVLSGTGGDEFNAGYLGRYQALGLTNSSRFNVFAHWGREKKYKSILNALFTTQKRPQVFTSEFLKIAGSYDANQIMDDLIKQCPSEKWSDRVFYVDAKTYLTGLLTFEDKVSMAHSLEARVPLLDNELIDFILDIPFEMLCKKNVGKLMFREAVKPWVPESIFNKPKMGFGPPDVSWYRGALRPWIESELNETVIKKTDVLQPAFVKTILAEHFAGKRNHTYIIWSLLNFQSWCRNFNFFQ